MATTITTHLYTPPPPEPIQVVILEEHGEYALVETQCGAIHFAKKEHLTPNKEAQR